MPDPDSSKPKGFAGLDDMTSKVEVPRDPFAALAPSASVSARAASRSSPSKPAPEPKPAAKGMSMITKLGIGVVVVVVLIGFANSGKNRDSTVEVQPVVGSTTALGSDQIRYCLSERVRLDAWKGAVNGGSPRSTAAFNSAIDDYNGRCGRFRYKQSIMTSVQEGVDARRAELVKQGLAKAAANP